MSDIASHDVECLVVLCEEVSEDPASGHDQLLECFDAAEGCRERFSFFVLLGASVLEAGPAIEHEVGAPDERIRALLDRGRRRTAVNAVIGAPGTAPAHARRAAATWQLTNGDDDSERQALLIAHSSAEIGGTALLLDNLAPAVFSEYRLLEEHWARAETHFFERADQVAVSSLALSEPNGEDRRHDCDFRLLEPDIDGWFNLKGLSGYRGRCCRTASRSASPTDCLLQRVSKNLGGAANSHGNVSSLHFRYCLRRF